MITALLAQALLTLKLSTTVGQAPVLTYARVTVGDLVRGQVCLKWEEAETPGVEESCWQAEVNPRTVWRNVRITEPGSYRFWAEAGNVRSNEQTVEVR